MLCGALALATMAIGGNASAAEFRIGAGAWNYDLTGTVTDNGRTYDFEKDLALETSGRTSATLEWDTSPGWYPDIAASYSHMGAHGSHTETTVIVINGIPIGSVTRTVVAAADFYDSDVALRYPWTWGGTRLTGGLVAKHLKGRVDIADSSQSQAIHDHYDEWIPEVQLGLRRPLGSWLTLAGTAQGVEYQGNKAYEWRALAEVRVLKPLILEGGWQSKRYRIDVDGYALDATVSGALLRAGFAF